MTQWDLAAAVSADAERRKKWDKPQQHKCTPACIHSQRQLFILKASLFTVVLLSDTFDKYSRCSPVVLVGS